MTHVPDEIKPMCVGATVATPGAAVELACFVTDGGIAVQYSQYSTVNAMDAQYRAALAVLAAKKDSGSCEETTWPKEGGYTVDEADAGRVACGLLGGTFAEMIWTDDTTSIMTTAIKFDAEQTALFTFWQGAGPID